jgi:cardiolipin synthase (CMP-forming)
MNLPNALTLARLISVPLTVWLVLSGQYLAAFWVFAASGATDGIDGYLARKWDQQTELGAYLDPLADKALMTSLYVVLAMLGYIPLWLTIAIVSRDVMIVGGVILAWVMDQPMTIRPLMISKVNTAAQILFIGVVLFMLGYGIVAQGPIAAGAWIVGALTLASAAAYLATWVRHTAGAASNG